MKRYATFLAVLLPACTAGRDYVGPPATVGAGPTTTFIRAGDATAGAPGLARWWEALGDPVLDSLQARALSDSPTLSITRARLAQARAGARIQRAAQLPSTNATALYLRGDLPPSNLGLGSEDDTGSDAGRSTIDLFNVGFDASWEPDLSGGQRRRVEGARAEAEAAYANVADAQVSLTADVAQTYVELRDRQQRIALAQRSATIQRDLIALLQQRVAAGTATLSDLEQAVRSQKGIDARAIPLEAERDVLLDSLAVLVGVAPGQLDAVLRAVRPVPMPPAKMTVGDPAALLQRRPDIRAAERTLASKSAAVGVADAARFPRVSFMGLLGLGGSDAGDVLDPGNLSLLAFPRLQWSFLDFGRNRARIQQAEAVRDEAEARYRATVLEALRDAEGSLSRFGGRRATWRNALETERSAQRDVAMIERRFAAGTSRRSDMLSAEQNLLNARDSSAQAATAVTVGYIGVHKALGLGWQ